MYIFLIQTKPLNYEQTDVSVLFPLISDSPVDRPKGSVSDRYFHKYL